MVIPTALVTQTSLFRFDYIFEQFPFVQVLFVIFVFVGAFVLFGISLGVYIVYLEILRKNPDLEQKCLEARPMHEEELEKTDPNIARYMKKKRLEEQSND